MKAVENIQKRLTFGLSEEQEEYFRQVNFVLDIAQARIFIFLITLSTIAFVVNDYSIFGFSLNFYGLLALRLGLVSYNILLLNNLRKIPNYLSYDSAVFLWGLFYVVSLIAIDATRPAYFTSHTIIAVLAVFTTFIAIPTRLSNQILLSLVLTAGEMLIIAHNFWTSPQASVTALLGMFFAETIAFASGWQLHSLRRQEFLDHEKLQKANIEVELQLTERKKAEEALKKTHDKLEEKIKERTKELEKAYNSLKESEEGLAEAQKMAHIGNWDWNPVTGEVYWSDELYRIFLRIPHESGATYDEFLNCVHPDDLDKVDKAFKKALNGESIAGDYRIILTNGEERRVHTHVEVIFDEKKIPVRIKGTVEDITERTISEEKLRESEEKYRNIVETANEGIYLMNGEAKVTYVNEKVLELSGYSFEEVIGRPIWNFISEESKPIAKKNLENRLQGINESYELKLMRKDGSFIWAFLSAKPFFNKEGKLTGYLGMFTDITKRKAAEEALVNIEIARKKEIHHRIKNNLQVISSLLDLQADKFRNRKNINDSEVLEAFRESQDRVISMALIHEELYRGGGFETLNFSQYVEELSENIMKTYSLGNNTISLKHNIDNNIFLDMDVAVPLGMIINELVSNSFKHAFKGSDEGEIRIELHRKEIGSFFKNVNNNSISTTFVLTISDNGVGMPANLDIEALNSLGLQLVTSLVSQLDGKLEIKRNKGSEFIIRFNVIENDNLISERAAKQLVHQ